MGSDWNWGNFANPMGGRPHGLGGGNTLFGRDEGVRPNNPKDRRNMALMTDGTSNTIVIGEAMGELSSHTFSYGANNTLGTTAVPLNHYVRVFQNTIPRSNYFGDGTNFAPFWDWPNNYSFASQHTGGTFEFNI